MKALPNRSGVPLLSVAATAFLLESEAALAHGNVAAGELYTGMLQPVLHFEALLPILAVALWSVQLNAPLLWRVPVAFAVAALAGSIIGAINIEIPFATGAASVVMICFGLLVAAKQRLSPAVAVALGILAGLPQGYAATFGEPAATQKPLLYITGFALGISLLLFHIENIAVRARKFWMQIGLRVIGSWIAAVGLMITMLSVLGQKLATK